MIMKNAWNEKKSEKIEYTLRVKEFSSVQFSETSDLIS